MEKPTTEDVGKPFDVDTPFAERRREAQLFFGTLAAFAGEGSNLVAVVGAGMCSDTATFSFSADVVRD